MGFRKIHWTLPGLLLSGCLADREAPTPAPPEVPMPRVMSTVSHRPPITDGKTPLLVLDVTTADSPDVAPKRPPRASLESISPEASEALLARVPGSLPADVPNFRLPPQGPPPPRKIQTDAQLFPPDGEAETRPAEVDDDDPLTVIRTVPQGAVRAAEDVQVQFSHPVAPVGDPALVEANVPVVLEPQPPGRWRVVEPRTLVFEPDEPPLPAATAYRLSVPEGLTTPEGRTLASSFESTFQTPPPTVSSVFPPSGADSVALDPVIVLVFDQRVDPATVLASTELEGGEAVAVRTATPTELESDPWALRAFSGAPPGHAVALTPKAPLPGAREIALTLRAGAWSAEGPRPAEAPFRTRFVTRGPLRIESYRCGWSEDGPCPPGSPIFVSFTNPLDPKAVPAARSASLEPALSGEKIEVTPNGLFIRGPTQARTTYRITPSPDLQDVFGQVLGTVEPLSIEVGPARPFLAGPHHGPVIRQLRGATSVRFLAAGTETLAVEVRAVQPSDWPQFRQALRGRTQARPGRVTFSEAVAVDGDPDVGGEVAIDVASALEDGVGHALLNVYIPGEEKRHRIQLWVVVSDVLLDAWSDSQDALYVSATGPKGAPLVAREIRMAPEGATALTNADGVARLPLLAARPENAAWLECSQAGFLPESAYGRGEAFTRRAPTETRISFLTLDDRGLYRPGETAHLKGYVRRFVANTLEPPETGLSIEARVHGPRGNEWSTTRAKLGAHGSFSFEVDIPEDANLGRARIELSVEGLGRRARHIHLLRVEEFRRPAFEVAIDVEAPPHVVGETFRASARAEAYGGGAVSGTPAHWQVEETSARYTPPGWDGWRFGKDQPWWWFAEVGRRPGASPAGVSYRVEDVTDSAGRSTLELVPRSAQEGFPVGLSLTIDVEDVDRRSVSAGARALVHPADRSIGLRPKASFLKANAPLDVEWVVVDLEGQAQANASVRLSLRPRPGFGPEAPDATSEAVATAEARSAAAPTTTRLNPPERPGRYLLRAEVEDERGRRSRTETFVYWSGAPARSVTGVDQESLELAPDKQRYRVGDTALVEVRSPLAQGRGAWMVLADGIARFEMFSIEDGAAQLRIPLTRALAPGAVLEAWVVGGTERPRQAIGRIPLDIDLAEDRLSVEVIAPPESDPGAETELEIRVRDARGQAVAGAEVALAVADEAVLAVAEQPWPDPLEALLPKRRTFVRAIHARADLVLEGPGAPLAEGAMLKDTEVKAERAMMMAPAGAAPGGGGDPIDLRSELRPLAHFAPQLMTDDEGRAVARFRLPDDLTRWRARAVAAAGSKIGRGETAFVARKPVSVSPALPRFLSLGDRPELGFIISNRTDRTQAVTLAVAAQGLTLGALRGGRTQVPPRSRTEVRFSSSVEAVGKATVRVALAAEDATDAVETTLPIYPPATQEAFAEHGSLTEDALVRQVSVPEGVSSAVGGLDIEVSSSRLLAARDAVRTLVEYPFDCVEQRASRLLALAAIREVLGRFGPETSGPMNRATLELTLRAEIEALQALQRDDGSWGFWPRADPNAFLTAHALHALARAGASEGGWKTKGVRALEQLESKLPEFLSESAKARLLAHGAYVRARLGDQDPKRLEAILERAGGETKAHPETLAWLSGAARGSTQRRWLDALGNRITVTARTAHLRSPADGSAPWVLHGERRADAVLLLDLLEARPKDPLIEPLLEGLLAGRRATGSWAHTQESAWALLALARYAEVREATPPAFEVGAWLGDLRVASSRFAGRDGPRKRTRVPMAWLEAHPDARSLILSRKGQGRLYYRLGLDFARADGALESVSRGFTVRRSYEAVDAPSDLRRTEDGWRVRAGARIRVRLELVTTGPRHHVALVDRLPASFEPLYSERTVPGPLMRRTRGDLLWFPWTWAHENLRDTGAEAFAVDLRAGLHRYAYLVRATSVGRYRAPPTRAEEMYAPETFGHSEAEWVTVFE